MWSWYTIVTTECVTSLQAMSVYLRINVYYTVISVYITNNNNDVIVKDDSKVNGGNETHTTLTVEKDTQWVYYVIIS